MTNQSKLTIIGNYYTKHFEYGYTKRCVLCRCSCGNIAEYILSKVKNCKVTSCQSCHIHGHTTHGLHKHRLNQVYRDMKSRCYNKNNKFYYRYGERGITVCEEWLNNFMLFYIWAIDNGWKKGLILDRKDNDGNYEPNNCRFVNSIISDITFQRIL